MYKEQPWTLEEKKLRVRKSAYIKNRESDEAISTSRVQKLLQDNKEKSYSNNEIASILGISLGTVSDITNRLQSIGDFKIVKVRQLKFQHASGSLPAVTKERGKEDVIVSVYSLFCSDINKIYTREELMKNLDNSESKVRRALQILLLTNKVKLVGKTYRNNAAYQHADGNEVGCKIYQEEDVNYTTITDYLKKHVEFKNRRKEINKALKNKKIRLFYSSKGMLVQYLEEDIDKVIKNFEKKGILNKLFNV